jgi:transposase
MVIDALLWLAKTGAPWRDLPERFGPWRTVVTRRYGWTRSGLWDRILAELRQLADAAGRIDWEMHLIDGTSERAHRCAAGGKGGQSQALGRNRGGGARLGPRFSDVDGRGGGGAQLVRGEQRFQRLALAFPTFGKLAVLAAEGFLQPPQTLHVSRNTVRNHVTTICEKIDVHRRSDAIIWGRERGFVRNYKDKPGRDRPRSSR